MRKFNISVNGRSYIVEVEEVTAVSGGPVSPAQSESSADVVLTKPIEKIETSQKVEMEVPKEDTFPDER
jgi:hypothetical protein